MDTGFVKMPIYYSKPFNIDSILGYIFSREAVAKGIIWKQKHASGELV